MPRVAPGQGVVVASAGDGALMPGEGERGEETLQLAEEEAAAFSDAVVELLSSRARWEHESEGARARVAAHFTAEQVHEEVRPPPPPPPSRSNWTRLVPLPVLTGRVSSLLRFGPCSTS